MILNKDVLGNKKTKRLTPNNKVKFNGKKLAGENTSEIKR